MQAVEGPQRVHPVVVALVAFHVLMITIYALPKPSPPVVEGRAEPRGSDAFLKWNDAVLKTSPVVTGYTYTTGAWQYWDMFAPNPAQTDIWCDADVIYFDGTTVKYQYPRMKASSTATKFVTERFRKYYERVNLETNKWLWESFRASHRLRECKRPPESPGDGEADPALARSKTSRLSARTRSRVSALHIFHIYRQPAAVA